MYNQQQASSEDYIMTSIKNSYDAKADGSDYEYYDEEDDYEPSLITFKKSQKQPPLAEEID